MHDVSATGMDRPLKRRGRRIKSAIWVSVSALAIASLLLYAAYLEPALPTVPRSGVVMARVERGVMRVELRGSGKLTAKRVHWVTSIVSGVVVERPCEPGETIEADAVLVRLRNPQLELDVLNAEAAVSDAKTALTQQRAEAESVLLDIDATIEQLESDAQLARMRLDADEQLFEKELKSELDLCVSRENLRALQATLAAQKRKRAGMARLGAIETDALAGQLEQAQTSLAFKQQRLSALDVHAGMAGVLQPFEEGAGVGMLLKEGALVARVSSPEEMKAVVELPESQAGAVRSGMLASLAFLKDTVPGEVARIDPAVVDGAVLLDVLPTEPLPQGVRPEQSLTCTIVAEQLNNVLHVRRPVYSVAGQPGILFKLEPDARTMVQTAVVFGKASVQDIEVSEGLHEGDTVIVSDMRRFEEHSRVRLAD